MIPHQGLSANHSKVSKTIVIHLIDSSIKSDYRLTRTIRFLPQEFYYNDLIEKLKTLLPDQLEQDCYYLTCKDEAGIKYPVTCDKDFECVKKSSDVRKKLFVVVNNDFENYSDDPNDQFHCQYFCDYCGYALKHFRFKCMICPQYDICKICHRQRVHMRFHEMKWIKIQKANSKNKAPVIDFESLITQKQLGEGYYSDVYLAATQDKTVIAVKVLKEKFDLKGNFQREIKILKKVGQHENIVRILGECSQPMAIIMEPVTMYLDKKHCSGLNFYLIHLRQKFEENNSRRLKGFDYSEFDSFAIQIARGMDHLEMKKIIHGDLAARNVLIDSNKTLKLTDFGLAKYENDQGADVCQSRWSAPEVIKNKKFSHKSDVWSFGIVLWEIATLGGEPYYDLRTYPEVNRFVGNGGHMKKPANVSMSLFDIMEKCWTYKPNKRQSFKDLVQRVNDFKWTDSAYIPFEKFHPNFKLPPVYEPELKKFRKFFC